MARVRQFEKKTNRVRQFEKKGFFMQGYTYWAMADCMIENQRILVILRRICTKD